MPVVDGGPIRVAFVEDHEAVRTSIQTMLGRHGCVVTASEGTAAEGYEAIVAQPPDVAILDVELPDESGPALARRLLARLPDLRILLYTGAQDHALLAEALEVGVLGFALKAGSLAELREAVHSVAAGKTYVDARLRSTILSQATTEHISVLTKREREVLELLARGLSGEEAAKELFLSPETIRVHVRNAMRKLEAHTRVHAVVIAIQQGAIDAET